MNDVRVKVVCSQCGSLLCRIVDGDDGSTFYRSPIGKGMVTSDPGAIFCSEHGWPDLTAPALADRVSEARRTGNVATHRAACTRVRPIP